MDDILSRVLWAAAETEAPPGGEVNYVMARPHPGHRWPRFRERTSKTRDQTDSGTEEQPYLNHQGDADRRHVANVKLTLGADGAHRAGGPAAPPSAWHP